MRLKMLFVADLTHGGSGNGRTRSVVVTGPFFRSEGSTPIRQGVVSISGNPSIALSATLAGAGDFVETVLWGTEHLAFLKRFYPYARGIPSHDTLCDVFAALDGSGSGKEQCQSSGYHARRGTTLASGMMPREPKPSRMRSPTWEGDKWA